MSVMDVRPFFPIDPTVNIPATTASAQVALTLPASQQNQEVPSTVRVVNPGLAVAFIEFGTSSAVVAAVATSMPIPPGSQQTFLLPLGITNAAAIMASGSATIYFTSGKGT